MIHLSVLISVFFISSFDTFHFLMYGKRSMTCPSDLKYKIAVRKLSGGILFVSLHSKELLMRRLTENEDKAITTFSIAGAGVGS